MNVYTVELTPPQVVWAQRDDLAALYKGPTQLRVRAESAKGALDKAQAMLPWRLYPQGFAAEAVACRPMRSNLTQPSTRRTE